MMNASHEENHEHGPECGCHPGTHHHPAVAFTVDGEQLVVHTARLTVREILDLVSEDPTKHYLVELADPENISYRNPDDVVELKECAEFMSVYISETPLS